MLESDGGLVQIYRKVSKLLTLKLTVVRVNCLHVMLLGLQKQQNYNDLALVMLLINVIIVPSLYYYILCMHLFTHCHT